MLKIDLHSHSYGSHDGCLSSSDIAKILTSGRLNVIAITDHDHIETAKKLQAEFGDHIIIGEEITTSQGEIIGLYLDKLVEPGQTALATTRAIKAQGGLVYVPHPFDRRRRSGLSLEVLEQIKPDVDIIETGNGRDYFSHHAKQAQVWAKQNNAAQAHSSDSHGPIGWGKTYSLIEQTPSADNLVAQLKQADYGNGRVGLMGLLYPAINRWRGRRG